MPNEQHRELVRRFNRIVATGDFSTLDELITPDFVAHNGDTEVRGPDGWRAFVKENHERFGAVETGVDELLDDGGLVAERWWFKAGGGDGPRLSGHGITVHRIENNKLAENWAIFQPDE